MRILVLIAFLMFGSCGKNETQPEIRTVKEEVTYVNDRVTGGTLVGILGGKGVLVDNIDNVVLLIVSKGEMGYVVEIDGVKEFLYLDATGSTLCAI